jgi:ring-1,2-phenylacetyl-CoA epoxidase subunit PaaD
MPPVLSTADVYQYLEEVKDPEIPVLSIVDLGVITSITIDQQSVVVEMTPTFTGCPAIDVMRSEIIDVLKKRGVEEVKVNITFRVPWTSDRISEKGRTALRRFGLAPPPAVQLIEDLNMIDHAICPRCNGDDTELRTPFGSTLCRSIYFCHACRESFEQFKPL